MMERRRINRLEKEETRRREQLEKLQKDVQADLASTAEKPSSSSSTSSSAPSSKATVSGKPAPTEVKAKDGLSSVTDQSDSLPLSATKLNQLKHEYDDPDEGTLPRLYCGSPVPSLTFAVLPHLLQWVTNSWPDML